MNAPAAPPIAFIDLAAQRRRLGKRIDETVMRVIDGGAYIMGPEVKAFEAQMSAFGEASHTLSCANGTEAIVLPLMAWNIRPGDAIFCPASPLPPPPRSCRGWARRRSSSTSTRAPIT
jgi:UDP-2-acetamido-2-deoxy-ribo-hexuluronate aminotransferase